MEHGLAPLADRHPCLDVARRLFDQQPGFEQCASAMHAVEIGGQELLMQRIEARKADDQNYPDDGGEQVGGDEWPGDPGVTLVVQDFPRYGP
ncbi:MAG: hypothetical protein U1E85_04970 [Rhodocyclaceae bacterium]